MLYNPPTVEELMWQSYIFWICAVRPMTQISYSHTPDDLGPQWIDQVHHWLINGLVLNSIDFLTGLYIQLSHNCKLAWFYSMT